MKIDICFKIVFFSPHKKRFEPRNGLYIFDDFSLVEI
jgi:hypothetical protein